EEVAYAGRERKTDEFLADIEAHATAELDNPARGIGHFAAHSSALYDLWVLQVAICVKRGSTGRLGAHLGAIGDFRSHVAVVDPGMVHAGALSAFGVAGAVVFASTVR